MSFLLKRDPRAGLTARKAEERTARARALLEDASAGLVFDPVPHTYVLGERELASVSSIVEWFVPFDQEAVALASSKNPKSQYYGMEVSDILAGWEAKRDEAAAAGTAVHAFGEACCLWMTGREDLIEPEFRDRITSEGLAAVTPKEVACALWWRDLDWSRYAVTAKETRLANPSAGYAGTMDLLLYDLEEDGFRLKDYKTNENLRKWYGDRMRPPLDFLKAYDIDKYTVQQTLYTIEMRSVGLRILSNDLVWLKEESYEEVGLDMRYDKMISYAAGVALDDIRKHKSISKS